MQVVNKITKPIFKKIEVGILVQTTSCISDIPKGIQYKSPNRYNHFIKTKGLYLEIKFFTKTKYNPYDVALIKTRKLRR